MIENLVEFIDNFSVDEQLYWRVAAGDAWFEVMWRRGNRKTAWNLRLLGHTEWSAMSSSELLASLNSKGAETASFEKQVGVSVLTQAVFADMVLEAANRIFGPDAIRRSITDTREFLNSVTELANQHTRSPRDEDERPHLRLVTN